METQLFTWEEWDIMSNFSYMFYDCTVTEAFGPYEEGDKLDSVYINYEKVEGQIEVYETKGEEPSWNGQLELKAVEK